MPGTEHPHSTTELLIRFEEGEGVDLERLVPLVYAELRSIAHRQLMRERSDHTLRTTALVNEAYLRLVDAVRVSDRGRAYFFAAAARAMRQILVDYARRRNAAKRGGSRQHVELDEAAAATDAFAAEILDLDGALVALRVENQRAAQVVECRFFGGLTVDETAKALGLSPRTVKYVWALARAWLYDFLHPDER